MAAFSAVVEGTVDEAVVRRLASEFGVEIGAVYGKRGKPHLLKRLEGYNAAARHTPWFVLVDLDKGCAPDLMRAHLPEPSAQMCMRVAVPQVEAWLLADSVEIARFLSVSVGRVPVEPDALQNSKNEVIGLARRSRSSSIRVDMIGRPGSGRPVGPAYTSRLIEFIEGPWRPRVARGNSRSLDRCIGRFFEAGV